MTTKKSAAKKGGGSQSMGMRVLITGASRGMGFAIAKRLAPRCSVILGTSKSEPRIEAAIKSLTEAHPATKFYSFATDLGEGREAANKIASWAEKHTDALDAIVLNAGFYIAGQLQDFSEADMRQNLEVNFLVNHFLVQSLLPLLRRGKTPRIVIIGSTAAYEPYPTVPTYGVAKWALRGLAVNLRNELAKERIGVTFLSPGATWTGMWEGEDLPRNRLLEASDVAELVNTVLSLNEQAVVEEVIVRPMEGDFHE